MLLTDEGEAVFDSRAITQYLNRISGGALFPRNAAKRIEAERLEALADGICDCLLAHVYERRSRPEEMVHQPWLDKQWGKAIAALDHLIAAMPKLPRKPTAGHIALRATLGYLDLRFPGQMGTRAHQAEALGGPLRREISGAGGLSAVVKCEKPGARPGFRYSDVTRTEDQNFMPMPKVTRFSFESTDCGPLPVLKSPEPKSV